MFQWKRQGEGTIIYKNNDKYRGHWANDLRDGEGTLEFFDGGKFEGAFLNGNIAGPGTFIDKYRNKFTTLVENEESKSGKFINGELCGMAELEGLNGLRYKGMYQFGKCHGKGRLTFIVDRNGMKEVLEYKGMFKCNFRSGKGKMEWKDGTEIEGDWVSDYISKGTYKLNNKIVKR